VGALEVSVIRQFDLSIVTVRCFRASAASANIMSNVKEAMLQHVLSLARGGVIISPQFFVSCTGYQSASEFISRFPAGFFRHWPAKHLPTSPTTAAWYQTRTDANSGLLILELVTPRMSTRFGDKRFSAAGPQVWNSLPSALRASDLTFHHQFTGSKTRQSNMCNKTNRAGQQGHWCH